MLTTNIIFTSIIYFLKKWNILCELNIYIFSYQIFCWCQRANEDRRDQNKFHRHRDFLLNWSETKGMNDLEDFSWPFIYFKSRCFCIAIITEVDICWNATSCVQNVGSNNHGFFNNKFFGTSFCNSIDL